MNEQEEKYIHFAYCIDSLKSAWLILNKLKQQKGNPLIGYAFQFAMIEYSKPYKESRGAILNTKGKPKHKYKLGTEFIPKEYLTLHKKLVTLRDEFHAHLDLGIRDATVHVQKTKHGRNVIRGQNIIYGTEDMENIDQILDLIEKTLNAMIIESRKLQDSLDANL